MRWKPDKSNSEPLYKQIARYYEEQILNGNLLPGTSLPTERELAQSLQVNRSTVTAAYEELRSTGLVQSVQGSGTWVNNQLWGVAPRNIPNWQSYTSGGTFLPTLPLVKIMREAANDPAVIQVARAELAPELIPVNAVDQLLRKKAPSLSLHYTDAKGDPDLREAVANHLHKHDKIAVTPDQILITSGAQQALHIITLCLLNPGDAVAMEGPSYTYSLPLFISAGLRLYRLTVDQEGLRPEEIRTLYKKHKIRMVFTNPTFHNPTGTILSLKRRKELLSICADLRIPIIEDDAYGAVALDDTNLPLSIMALNQQGNGNSVIYIGSLSKTVASGLRIGWIVGPKLVIDRLADAKQQMDYGTSSISQQLVAAYLTQHLWEEQIKRIKTELTNRRNLMLQALEQELSDYADWNVPKGSYHVWCRLKEPVPEKLLLSSAIQQGILFTPGSIYGGEPGYIRLTYSWEKPERIQEGIRRFREVLKRL